jgi:putative MATE family efflux protein
MNNATRLDRKSLLGPSSFYKKALDIALPAMLQQLIMALVSLVDNFMVAGLGDTCMAAVNVSNQVNFIYFTIINTLSTAGGIYIAQYSGANDREGMKQAFRFNVIATGMASALYLVLCLSIPDRLLGMMLSGNAARADIIHEGSGFLRVVSFMWVGIGLSTSIAAALRVTGDTRAPLFISSAATLLNTFLSWLLIYGNLGAPRLEVMGAAVATDLARAVELALFLIYLKRKRPDFAFKVSTLFKIDPRVLKSIFSRSWMMIVSESTWVLTETVLTALFNGRGGAETVAGVASGFTIANIFFLAFIGIHTATAAIVGNTLGADRLDEARGQARWIKSGAVIMGLGLAAIEALSVLIIPVVFGNLSPSAQGITRQMVFTVSAFMPLWTLLNAQFAISRTGGDALMGFLVDVVVSLAVFLPLAFLLATYTALGPVALFAAVKSTDILKAIVAEIWLRKERWVRNLTNVS